MFPFVKKLTSIRYYGLLQWAERWKLSVFAPNKVIRSVVTSQHLLDCVTAEFLKFFSCRGL